MLYDGGDNADEIAASIEAVEMSDSSDEVDFQSGKVGGEVGMDGWGPGSNHSGLKHSLPGEECGPPPVVISG